MFSGKIPHQTRKLRCGLPAVEDTKGRQATEGKRVGYFTGATMRGLAAGAMVGIAVVSAATPVLAAPSDGYPGPPVSPGIVSSSSVSAGQTVLFSGGGFQPATTCLLYTSPSPRD